MPGLARALMQAGRLSAQQADSLHKKSLADKSPFIDTLLLTGTFDARTLAAFCAETFGYPLMDLQSFNLDALPANAIDAKLMQSQRVIALAKRGNKMSVAISDPTNIQALDQIKFQSEASVEPVIVLHDVLLTLLANLGRNAETSLNEMVGDQEDIQFGEEDAPATVIDQGAAEIEDAPIV
ncbi:MAG TPA: type IV-A pilus assembly ATPase PilB, partial [Telluria sp.]